MTELQRREINEREMKRLHPTLARKVAAVIKDLEGHGHKPYIASGWRSQQEQRAIYLRGDSTVLFSFHNAEKNGKACALAADIVDARYGWDSPKKYWEHLGSSCEAHSLVWGGRWKKFPDVAHAQLLPNSMLSKVRKGYIPPVT